MQSCNKPVDALCDILPIRQPVSREPKGDIGFTDTSLEEADTGIRHALARAAGKKMLGRVRFKHQVLALVRRVIAKSAVGQSRKAGDRLRHKIPWIDRLHTI